MVHTLLVEPRCLTSGSPWWASGPRRRLGASARRLWSTPFCAATRLNPSSGLRRFWYKSSQTHVLASLVDSTFPGKHARKIVEDLARPSPSGRPGSSTPAGFARMEPALCRIPLPYPSPWRPRKSHDRARPGGEVVAPRVTAPSPWPTFRLFSDVLGTENPYNYLKKPFGRN